MSPSSFFGTQLNGFKYFYVIKIILKLIKEFQELLFNSDNPIAHRWFQIFSHE